MRPLIPRIAELELVGLQDASLKMGLCRDLETQIAEIEQESGEKKRHCFHENAGSMLMNMITLVFNYHCAVWVRITLNKVSYMCCFV